MLRTDRRAPFLLTLLLLAGFIGSVLVRTIIGGVAVAQSAGAGLVFAGCLLVLVLLGGGRWYVFRFSWRAVVIGVLGGLFLLVPAFVSHVFFRQAAVVSLDGYVPWAFVVAIVAFAEELFLRGVLFDVLVRFRWPRWNGQVVALTVTSLLFGLLHVPLYGWHVVPLDCMVGLWFGLLRLRAQSVVAPITAHVLADLAMWWVR